MGSWVDHSRLVFEDPNGSKKREGREENKVERGRPSNGQGFRSERGLELSGWVVLGVLGFDFGEIGFKIVIGELEEGIWRC